MMTFEAEAPGPGLCRRAEEGEGEPLRGALAGAVAARRQHILQRHDVPGLLDAARRQQGRQQVPGRGLLRGIHLLEPQARLDVAGGAEIVPAGPLRPVPRERGRLALIAGEASEQPAGRVEKSAAGAIRRGRDGGPRQRDQSGERGAGEHDAAAIGPGGMEARQSGLGHGHLRCPRLADHSHCALKNVTFPRVRNRTLTRT